MQQTHVSVVSITTPLSHPVDAKVKRNDTLVAVKVISHIAESGTSFNMIRFDDGREEKVHSATLVFK